MQNPDKELIQEGWRECAETYKPGQLSTEESAAFKRMALVEQANSECEFCFPSCKDFPNCKCARNNRAVYEKYGL